MEAWIIYGAPNCKWCEKAKGLLKLYDRMPGYVDITQDGEGYNFVFNQGFKTVPQIYHNGKHIGGYEDLVEYLK